MPSERKYAERLREQAYKTLSPQIKDLEQQLKELNESLSAGIYQMERKLEAAHQIELPTTDAVLDEIMEEILRQKNREEQSIAVFAREIRRKETQEEILGMLLDYAQRFFPRVGLFSVRNDRLIGWSSRGFNEDSTRLFADFSILKSECPQFREALDGEDIVTVPDLTENSSLSFLQAQSTGKQYLVPLYVLQRPAALLYAGESEGEISDTDALSILADLAVLRLENIALGILYALTGEKSASAPQAETESQAEPGAAAEPAPEEETASFEETVETAEEAPAEEVSPPPMQSAETDITEEQEPEPAPEEETAALEETAETTEEASSEEITEAEPAPEEAQEQAPQEEPLSEEEEEKLHSDAKRFARLLVSEIKLYNENHVAEGRNNRDLYLRLKRDIDKSREMYENRISPIVSRKADYFHDEIVRILGNDDPSTLGSEYPGSRVE